MTLHELKQVVIWLYGDTSFSCDSDCAEFSVQEEKHRMDFRQTKCYRLTGLSIRIPRPGFPRINFVDTPRGVKAVVIDSAFYSWVINWDLEHKGIEETRWLR